MLPRGPLLGVLTAPFSHEGLGHLAANYAQLRKVLCLDARSMEDASATGTDVDDQAAAA